MRRVDAGASFVITVHERPVADLVQHRRARSRRAVPLAEMRTAPESLGVVVGGGWRADIAEDEISDP